MILNALQIKILLAILTVLTVIAAVEIRRDRSIRVDPATANKLSHGAAPTKPYTVP